MLDDVRMRLNAVLERAPIVLWSTNEKGVITSAEGSGLSGLNFDPGKLLGATVFSLYSDEQGAKNLKRAFAGEAFSAENELKGTWFETHYSPLVSDSGKIIGVAGISIDITLRKSIEARRLRIAVAESAAAEIRESQQFLDSLIDHLPHMVFVKDAQDLKFVRLNRAGEELLGFNREDLHGKSDFDFFPALQAEMFVAKDREVLAGKAIVEIREEIIQTRVKGPRILHTKKVPIFDTQGKPKFLLGISEDITDARQVQLERDRFFTTSLDMLVISGMDGFFKRVNPVVEEILGYTPEEFCSIPYLDLIHPEDIEPTKLEIERQKQGRSVLSFENRYRCKDGSYKWLSWNSTPVDDLMYACARDVTAIKEAAAALMEAKERVEQEKLFSDSITKLAPNNIYIFDLTKMTHVYANKHLGEFLGYDSSELEAMGEQFVPRTLHPDDRESLASHLERVEGLLDGEVVDFECRVRHSSGAWHTILINERVFKRSPTGKPLQLVGIAQDITSQKKAEAGLRAASLAKSEFLANMSHEVRTPLNGIVGMTSLLQKSSLTEDQRAHVDIVKGSADALLAIVNDILDLSKAEAGKIELESIEFDPYQVVLDVKRALAYAASSKGLDLLVPDPVHLPAWVKGDPTRLRQVLMNLVSNAIKFTNAGTVRVEVQATAVTAERSLLKFVVSDTGVGIPSEAKDRLFRPFSQADTSTTRKFGGTGLGLSICRNLVTLMGGEIGCTSQPGEGATFWISVPLEIGHPERAAPATLEATRSVSKPGLRILLVEDNSINQIIALRMLEALGHKPIAVANGNEAINALSVAPLPYDLVLMDCQMPDLDGFEATRRIRNSQCQVPIIAMTASAMKGDREECLEAGMNEYISKPMTLEDLAAVIDKFA